VRLLARRRFVAVGRAIVVYLVLGCAPTLSRTNDEWILKPDRAINQNWITLPSNRIFTVDKQDAAVALHDLERDRCLPTNATVPMREVLSKDPQLIPYLVRSLDLGSGTASTTAEISEDGDSVWIHVDYLGEPPRTVRRQAVIVLLYSQPTHIYLTSKGAN
jgi:hypothetical protein